MSNGKLELIDILDCFIDKGCCLSVCDSKYQNSNNFVKYLGSTDTSIGPEMTFDFFSKYSNWLVTGITAVDEYEYYPGIVVFCEPPIKEE